MTTDILNQFFFQPLILLQYLQVYLRFANNKKEKNSIQLLQQINVPLSGNLVRLKIKFLLRDDKLRLVLPNILP